MIRYSIIIVNYKTPQLLNDCINTIVSTASFNETEIIVVDNDSADNSKELIMTSHPFVRWVDMGYNSGFARANNAGIKVSKGEIVLLLNSDTLNENNAIHNCFTRLENDSFVACGVQLLNVDRTPQISGNYVLRGGLNYLMALPYIGRMIRRIAISSGVKKTNIANATTTIEVDWINGAFLMVKKSAIAQVGSFDEDFFLYAEESEWCSRLKKAGKLCIYGDFNVLHLEGGSSNNAYDSKTKGYQSLSDKKGYQILLSNFVRFRKEFGFGWYLFHLVANLVTIPLFFIIVLLKSFFVRKGMRQEWKSWQGYSQNVLSSLKFFFDILLNRRTFYKVL